MFDRSFQRSRDYFTALQLLRLVDKWADDNVQALVSLAENWREKVRRQKASPEDVYLNERCFDDTIAEFKKRTAVIHKRVKVLREDITSLRDGVRLSKPGECTADGCSSSTRPPSARRPAGRPST